MKKLVRKVELNFCEDDNGMFGLTHPKSLEGNFDAFYTGTGIFHDVFEHAHELEDPHFRGINAFNVGGEIAAMGQLAFFAFNLHLESRLNPIWRTRKETIISATHDYISEAIKDGYFKYGKTLESGVPNQSPIESEEIEELIKEHIEQINELKPLATFEEEKEYAESVTPEKIKNLYRYGWRMGEELLGKDYDWRNCKVLDGFISFWNKFCQKNNAKDLKEIYKSITFKIYRENNLISWSAVLNPIDKSEVKTKVFKGNRSEVSNVPNFLEDFLK